MHAQSPKFIYHFTHTLPPWLGFRTDYDVPKAKGYTYFNGSKTGAFHAAEIPYSLDSLRTNVDQQYSNVDRGIADCISQYWVNFMKSGDPNGDGLAYWLSAAEDENHVTELGKEQ